MIKITKENAVTETAFRIMHADAIHLRWFTPETKMDLCGYVVIAVAPSLATILGYKKEESRFETLSGDALVKLENGIYKKLQ